jgi:hypothetical protein
MTSDQLPFDADPALAPQPGGGRRGVPLSATQREVLNYVISHGTLTLRDAVRFFGQHYYSNAERHTGAMLSRMVRRGLLVRDRRGVYALQPDTTSSR